MEFKGRSLYNLLRIKSKEDPSLETESWQIEDYRSLSQEELFSFLKDLGVVLNKEHFLSYADSCGTPEELLECLWLEEWEEEDLGERAYLVLLELWRKLLPLRRSLSIFFDDLDFYIECLEETESLDEEAIMKTLRELEDILGQGKEQQMDPQELFSMVVAYSANDVEAFLYDYIVLLLEEGNDLLASTLIEMFEKYVPEKKWFDLLRVRLIAGFDSAKALALLHQILEEEKEEECFDDLFMEGLFDFFLSEEGEELFIQSIRLLLACVKVEGDLVQFLEFMAEFFNEMESLSQESSVRAFLEERLDKDPEDPLINEDRKEVECFLFGFIL